MASLTDEMVAKASGNAKKALSEVAKMEANRKHKKQEKKNERSAPEEKHRIAKGICLMLGKGVKFTTKNVMKAVREKVLERTGNIKYSERNISIDELLKKGTVRKVESAITGDVMRHFDAECKKAKIKYSAMRDDSEPQNPQYYIFYEGRAADVIIHVMEQAYKAYMKEQEQEQQEQSQQDKNTYDKGNEERENPQEERKAQEKKQDKNTRNNEEERESVRAKLSFFRDRAAELDKEQDVTEKHKSQSEPQR